jgi:hypothetical protein
MCKNSDLLQRINKQITQDILNIVNFEVLKIFLLPEENSIDKRPLIRRWKDIKWIVKQSIWKWAIEYLKILLPLLSKMNKIIRCLIHLFFLN